MPQYNKVSPEIAEQIKAIVGEKRLVQNDAVGADFGHDEYPAGKPHAPEAVCLVHTTEEVAAILKICNENNIPVTPRGAGTGMAGGAVPLCGGLVIAMTGMDKIIGYDNDALTVRVQPGVRLNDLKNDARAQGFIYAPDPGEGTATIGGNASTNAGGPGAVKYGTTRDNVVGATVVLADGEVLKLGGNVGKNSSGYSLLQLVIGSEGTLGIITELILKLQPKPKIDLSLILPFMDGESIPKAVADIRRAGMAPQSLEFIDTDIVEFAGAATGNPVFPISMDGERVGASLLLTFEGKDDEELDAKMEAIAEMSEDWGVMDILVVDTPTLKKEVWAAHEAFHTAVESAAKQADELNMVVPAKEMPGFISYVKDIGGKAGLSIFAYGHAGDGGLHIYICSNESDTDAFELKVAQLMDKAYAKCAEMGGLVSSEHGIGYAKKSYLQQSLGEAGYALMQRIKEAFDPNGILNPGKVSHSI